MTHEMEHLEQHLMRAASVFRYPRTPDLLASRREVPAPSSRARLAWIAAAMAVVVVAIVAVPPVRAAVVEILGIGSVQIELGPSIADGQIGLSELPGETTLSAARDISPAPIRLPSYPSNLGAPDRVFLLEEVGGTVVLVWEQAESDELARLALYVIPAGELVRKLSPETVERVVVSGEPALWTTGDHFLEIVTGDPEKRVLVTGNVLIWTEDGTTYRLETDLPLSEAISIAESLQQER
jgi:hypothetical protein